MAEIAAPVRRALIVGTVVVAALGGLCGWLGYRAVLAHRDQQLRELLLDVGRREATNLTSIDYQRVEADVEQILALGTGQFYNDFRGRSTALIDVVRRVQSKSTGTVTEAGLESVDGQEGQVLVAVTVTTTNSGVAEPQPHHLGVRLTVTREGDTAKVSKVDFVR